MSEGIQSGEWKYYRFGLFVTGEGEREFLPRFLRALMSSGNCTFDVIRQVGQRSPISSQKRVLRMVGKGQKIPSKEEEEIGLPARRYLKAKSKPYEERFVILVDDLEFDRRDRHQEVFERYRTIFDVILSAETRPRVAVHFLVPMIEAYYFADAEAVNAVLGTDLEDFEGDVEAIRHPKNELKRIKPGFDEKADGRKIVPKLDLEKVLNNPETCSSLRALFKWCSRAKRDVESDRFQLASGACSPVTGPQVDALRSDESVDGMT